MGLLQTAHSATHDEEIMTMRRMTNYDADDDDDDDDDGDDDDDHIDDDDDENDDG